MANKNANDRLIVVKHKPGIKRKRRLFFITGIVVMGALSFLLGNYQIRQQHQKVLDRLDSLFRKWQKYRQCRGTRHSRNDSRL